MWPAILKYSIYCKFISSSRIKPPKKEMNLQYRNAVIADNTKAIKITFWQNCVDAVEQEKFYKITNCITTSFNNEIWINTTSNSKITEIELFGEVFNIGTLLMLANRYKSEFNFG
jgi:ssDNA-binding replication factor A large subunit